MSRRFSWRRTLHRYADPLLAMPKHWRAWRGLQGLSDGDYVVPYDVPYVAQFASPDLIHAYIHQHFDARHDPHWRHFGAERLEDYAFWAPRVCALAVIKMAAAVQGAQASPSLWELVQQGLALDGYRHYDERGRLVDEGWYFHAQVALARRYGLTLSGYDYAPPMTMLPHLLEGHLIAAAVSPELGERVPLSRRYGGHVVLVYGFRWQAGQLTHLFLHNPSGRFPELQASACILLAVFRRQYAYRFAVFEPSC